MFLSLTTHLYSFYIKFSFLGLKHVECCNSSLLPTHLLCLPCRFIANSLYYLKITAFLALTNVSEWKRSKFGEQDVFSEEAMKIWRKSSLSFHFHAVPESWEPSCSVEMFLVGKTQPTFILILLLDLCERNALHLSEITSNKIRRSDVRNSLFGPFYESIAIVEC